MRNIWAFFWYLNLRKLKKSEGIRLGSFNSNMSMDFAFKFWFWLNNHTVYNVLNSLNSSTGCHVLLLSKNLWIYSTPAKLGPTKIGRKFYMLLALIVHYKCRNYGIHLSPTIDCYLPLSHFISYDNHNALRYWG